MVSPASVKSNQVADGGFVAAARNAGGPGLGLGVILDFTTFGALVALGFADGLGVGTLRTLGVLARAAAGAKRTLNVPGVGKVVQRHPSLNNA